MWRERRARRQNLFYVCTSEMYNILRARSTRGASICSLKWSFLSAAQRYRLYRAYGNRAACDDRRRNQNGFTRHVAHTFYYLYILFRITSWRRGLIYCCDVLFTVPGSRENRMCVRTFLPAIERDDLLKPKTIEPRVPSACEAPMRWRCLIPSLRSLVFLCYLFRYDIFILVLRTTTYVLYPSRLIQ